MRVVVSLVVIVCIFAALYIAGVGRGYNACVESCQSEHCDGHFTADMTCTSPDFKPCIEVCKKEHKD